MFRMWGKIFASNHMLRDDVYEDGSDLNRTGKVFKGLESFCQTFDLPNPIWLDSNIKEFQRHAKCRFTKDSFIEDVEFDYLEIQVLEED